jgi:hypothetical protein
MSWSHIPKSHPCSRQRPGGNSAVVTGDPTYWAHIPLDAGLCLWPLWAWPDSSFSSFSGAVILIFPGDSLVSPISGHEICTRG